MFSHVVASLLVNLYLIVLGMVSTSTEQWKKEIQEKIILLNGNQGETDLLIT
jgi:hypothetical protein